MTSPTSVVKSEQISQSCSVVYTVYILIHCIQNKTSRFSLNIFVSTVSTLTNYAVISDYAMPVHGFTSFLNQPVFFFIDIVLSIRDDPCYLTIHPL